MGCALFVWTGEAGIKAAHGEGLWQRDLSIVVGWDWVLVGGCVGAGEM